MSEPTRLSGFPTGFDVNSLDKPTGGRDRRCAGAYTADVYGKPVRHKCRDQAAQDKDGNWMGLCEACSGIERDFRRAKVSEAQPEASTSVQGRRRSQW